MNANGTGPLFIRLPRGGDIAGRIEVGKADHGTQLEISVRLSSCSELKPDHRIGQYILLYPRPVHPDRYLATVPASADSLPGRIRSGGCDDRTARRDGQCERCRRRPGCNYQWRQSGNDRVGKCCTIRQWVVRIGQYSSAGKRQGASAVYRAKHLVRICAQNAQPPLSGFTRRLAPDILDLPSRHAS
jgi:hypothetical protein